MQNTQNGWDAPLTAGTDVHIEVYASKDQIRRGQPEVSGVGPCLGNVLQTTMLHLALTGPQIPEKVLRSQFQAEIAGDRITVRPL